MNFLYVTVDKMRLLHICIYIRSDLIDILQAVCSVLKYDCTIRDKVQLKHTGTTGTTGTIVTDPIGQGVVRRVGATGKNDLVDVVRSSKIL